MTYYQSTPPEPEVPGGPPRGPGGPGYWGSRPPWYVALVGGAILVILVAVLLLLLRDDDSTVETVSPTLTSVSTTASSTTDSVSTTVASTSTTVSTTTTTEASTTTSEATTTTSETTTTTEGTTTTVDPDVYLSAIWPWFESSLRYDDPVEAALGFAEDFVGFTDPIAGEFMQGDSRSGEVEIKPTESGPITTVFVRQLDASNTWWILGAVTEHTNIEEPGAIDVIDSPLQVSGQALAFEGVVDFELRADGEATPLVTGTVLGGGGEMSPFEGEFSFDNPGEGGGAVLLLTKDQDDDGTWTVAAVRVSFSSN